MIRKYRKNDLNELLAVWEAASAVAHPYLSEDFVAQERRNIPELYLPNAETWVWEAEGRVVGFVSMLGNEVGGLFVAPESHRKGIGGALLDRVRGVREELEVEVFSANVIGRAFYTKYGFQLLHEKVHEPTGFDLLRLHYAPSSNPDRAGWPP